MNAEECQKLIKSWNGSGYDQKTVLLYVKRYQDREVCLFSAQTREGQDACNRKFQ